MKLKVFHDDIFYTDMSAEDIIASKVDSYLAETGEQPLAALVLFNHHTAKTLDLSSFKSTVGNIPVVGCSTESEFSSVNLDPLKSIVVALFTDGKSNAANSNVKAHELIVNDLSKKTEAQIRSKLNKQILEKGINRDKGMIFCFSESLNGVSGDIVARAAGRSFGPKMSLVGGMAADGWKFEETFQCFDGMLVKDAAVFLVLEGDVNPSFKTTAGFSPVSEEKYLVEAASGPEVSMISGMSAADFYKSFLGYDEVALGDYPLEVSFGASQYHRAPLERDCKTGIIKFAGDVPVGARVRITRVDSAKAMVDESRNIISTLNNDKECTAVFAVICAGRKRLIGSRTSEIVEQIKLSFPKDTSIFGFFSYGEYFSEPLQKMSTAFHNQHGIYCRF